MRRVVTGCLLVIGLFACGRATTPAPPPPAPAPVVVQPPPPPPTGRELARTGLTQFKDKQWDAAFATLTSAIDANPLVAPWLRLRLAEVERQRNNFASAAAILTQIIATAPDSSAATTATLRLPALLVWRGLQSAPPVTPEERGANSAPHGDADVATAMRAALAVPIDELTENELVDLAKQLDKASRGDLATSVRTHLLFDYPQGRYTEQTFGTLAALPDSPLDRLSFDEALALAQSLAKYDRYDQEFDVLSRIAKRFSSAQTSAALRNTRIRAQFHSRNYSQLLTETANVKLDDPAIALMRARAAWRAGHPDEFLAGLNAVEKQWPNTPTAAEAKVLRSKYYSSDVVDYPKAIENLTAAIAAGATGTDGENLWTLGFTQMLAGRANDALRSFDDYARRYPDGDYKTNALFWAGKIADKRGDTATPNARWSQLVTEYPYSYFSYRAQTLGGSALTPTPSANVFPNLDAEITAAADPRVDVVRELAAIDLHRDASQEMQRVVAAHPDNRGLQFLQADLYVEGGEPFKANNVLQRRFREFIRHGGTAIPQRFWQILFPLKYWDSYKAAGAQQNVDPYVLVAITRQESGFEPLTVSNAGAVGLMQIMPAEAASISQRANLGAVTREQLFDPATNISVGAAEFAQKRAAMNGNETLAIAAYNAGEDAVGKWLAQTPVDDIDLFIEAIPYAETRLYVKTVSRNRYEYRRIYETSSTSSSSQQKP